MMKSSFITNGPYLLNPATQQMTIAWEMKVLSAVKVAYRMDEEPVREIVTRGECIGEFCMYVAVLLDLQPNAHYQYEIIFDGGESVEGSFKTLPQNPKQLKIVTLSDSHLFYTEKQFAAMVEKEKPDFMIHAGDISFGTGYQHDQYSDNWFQKIPEVLKNTPVVYVPGNHDDGPFYDMFFAVPQAKSSHCDSFGHTYSFTCGGAHFTMVDSNSWGLFEMNAVNSGLSVDYTTQNRIRQTLNWIKEDLNSEDARNAAWRVLVMHHPYTDEFNNRYIVPIAEATGVDLVVGGHLHYYVKTVSVNPKIGAGTVYISQGSTQDPEASSEKINGGRLLGDFPEVVAMGKNNYGLMRIGRDEIQYNMYGFTEKEGSDILVDSLCLKREESAVMIEEVELRRIDNNGNLEIKALARNCGKGFAAVTLRVFDNGEEQLVNLFGAPGREIVVALNGGEERHLTAIYKARQQGDHEIMVGNCQTRITVFEPPQLSFAHMQLSIDEKSMGNRLLGSIEATNNLEREIFVTVPLYIDQRIAESKNVFFRGNEKKKIDFCYKFDQGGSYQVSIADQLPKEIEIQGGIRIIPRIQDRSGNGHHGLLHGKPKVIATAEKVEVRLENYGDYIEIPANRDLSAPDGFSGMVFAKVERLAKKNEMGHNPLMVKGKSVGWGATYLLRMVIERAGGLKWGVCHDITEYSWQGGRVDLKEWAQYTIAFDKATGGHSYCNGECVAYVAGINKESELRQWEEEPIFIGYSYIGHVIKEIDRPKYFTHLPASVSQVRFYKAKLSAEQNRQIADAPQMKGPAGRSLAIWLDFRDILTVGTHITEWRHPAVFDPAFKTEKKYWRFKQLKTKASLPLQAALKAVIEVSDDASSVKASFKTILKNGTNYLDLSGLPEAQYIRIVTEFSAEVGQEGTFIPELQSYQVTACNETDFTEMFWSTQEDWKRGRFSGAVGFEPVGRLRDYPEYTDVIHG